MKLMSPGMALVTSASPVVSPGPVITFNTPGGSPASSANRASSMADNGVSSCGFSTIELPQMSAGAIFRIATASG